MKTKQFLAVFALSFFLFTSCKNNEKQDDMDDMNQEDSTSMQADQQDQEMQQMESNSIAAKAMNTSSLSTLVSALQSADLAETLKTEEGPFTVFAPTNEAFEKVDQATRDQLMKPENKDQLASVLKYHVVEGKIMASDLSKMIDDNNGKYEITTMNGGKLTAMKQDDKIMLKDETGATATVTQADVEASNGEIHIIDTVLMQKK